MPRRTAWASLVLFAGGIWLLVAGIWSGRETAALIGSGSFAAGVTLLLAQYVRLVVVVRRSSATAG